jgi:hypothetical protein
VAGKKGPYRDFSLSRSAKLKKNASRKLSVREVIAIKRRYKRKNPPMVKDTAKKYGLHPMTISYILNGRTWKHVQVD